MTLREYVAGNWKMHGTAADLAEIGAIALGSATHAGVDSALCLPATLIDRAVRSVPDFSFGGQDVHQDDKGAHTGCISAAMLIDAGATVVIVGHSERRMEQCESDAMVKAKAEAGLKAGLSVILCIGESLEVREAGTAVTTVQAQLDASLPDVADGAKLAIAYEPIWAIGTGRTASSAQAQDMHAHIRSVITAQYGNDSGNAMTILYGGSCKPSNAAELFACPDVDGGLIGGASLKADEFIGIIDAMVKS